MTFTKKIIEVVFTLSPVTDAAGTVTNDQPVFAGTNSNTVTLTGYRTSVHVTKAGGASMGEAHLSIYGMSLQLMNQLSTLGRTPVIIGRNLVSISAGDANGLSLIFQGTINQAFTDLGSAPDGRFDVDAYSLLFQAVQSIPPTSTRGSTDVALIMQNLSTQMGLRFENNGVTDIIPPIYLAGSAKSQAEELVKLAQIEWNQGDNGTVAIWPKNGSRNGAIPLISPQTGLVGYPYPSGGGLLGLKTLFNPAINFGSQIRVQSSITPACGVWTICQLEHALESEMPGGQWFTSLTGTPPGYLAVR